MVNSYIGILELSCRPTMGNLIVSSHEWLSSEPEVGSFRSTDYAGLTSCVLGDLDGDGNISSVYTQLIIILIFVPYSLSFILIGLTTQLINEFV